MSAELNLGKLKDHLLIRKYFTQNLIWDFLKDQRIDVTFAPCIITLQTKKR